MQPGPIFGTRRLDHVKENLGAAEVSLSDEDMAAIEARLAGIEIIGDGQLLADALHTLRVVLVGWAAAVVIGVAAN